MRVQALQCIVLACLMKLMCKLVELEFGTLDPAHFHRKNFTKNGTVPPVSKETCYFDSSISENPSGTQIATSWIYTARYMLPVLGGMVSSAWLGCNRVLQIGGSAMLLSTVLLSVSVYLGLICQGSSVVPITWLLLPAFYGLSQPSILLAIFRWHRKDKLCTVLTTTYYAFAVIGEMLSMPFIYRYFASERALGPNFTLVFVAVSLVFLTLTKFMPEVGEEEAFELPNQRKMMKYFQIFSALILFLAFEGDERPTIYKSELKYLTNGTVDISARTWMSPECIKCISFMVLSGPLVFVALMSRRKLAVQPRILSGILLKCAVELCLIIVTSVGLTSAAATVAVYSVMSILDGAVELLVMVAAYDLGCSLLPGSSQCLILGVMYTVRGLSNFVSRGLFLFSAEINKLEIGSKPLFFVYHLIAVLMLLACFFYHKFVTLPIADQMTPLSVEEEIDAVAHDQVTDDSNLSPEMRPLLEHA